MALFVSSIRFHLAARTGTVALRRNASAIVALPEWRLGQTFLPADAPVCWVISEIAGTDPVLAVELLSDLPSPGDVLVRAVEPPRADVPWWNQHFLHPSLIWTRAPFFTSIYDQAAYATYAAWYEFWQNLASSDRSMLGDVAPRLVHFGPDGRTGPQLFQLRHSRIAARGVTVQDVALLWQYRRPEDPTWQDIGVTMHRAYAVLKRPTLPWLELPTVNNSQLPWTDVLDVACEWARGALTPAAAAQRVTAAVFELGPDLLEYGCPIGAREMYANTVMNLFNCTMFLNRLRGQIGNGPYVNCTDCATIVSTFANILGCDIWQSRMGMYVPSFECFPTLLIGAREWESPCGFGLGFMYHEVGWTGACTAADSVYDACLLVDALPPIVGRLPIPLLPANMPFGFIGQELYRARLVVPADQLVAEPRPFERRRRVVV
jgi:hypothetical protein